MTAKDKHIGHVRRAINDTLCSLRPQLMGPALPESTRIMLNAHLTRLLDIELYLLERSEITGSNEVRISK